MSNNDNNDDDLCPPIISSNSSTRRNLPKKKSRIELCRIGDSRKKKNQSQSSSRSNTCTISSSNAIQTTTRLIDYEKKSSSSSRRARIVDEKQHEDLFANILAVAKASEVREKNICHSNIGINNSHLINSQAVLLDDEYDDNNVSSDNYLGVDCKSTSLDDGWNQVHFGDAKEGMRNWRSASKSPISSRVIVEKATEFNSVSDNLSRHKDLDKSLPSGSDCHDMCANILRVAEAVESRQSNSIDELLRKAVPRNPIAIQNRELAALEDIIKFGNPCRTQDRYNTTHKARKRQNKKYNQIPEECVSKQTIRQGENSGTNGIEGEFLKKRKSPCRSKVNERYEHNDDLWDDFNDSIDEFSDSDVSDSSRCQPQQRVNKNKKSKHHRNARGPAFDSSLKRFSDDEINELMPNFMNPRYLGQLHPYDLSKTSHCQIPSSINRYLLEYQKEGVRFMYQSVAQGSGAILGDDMGLGKTIQVIALLSALLRKSGTGYDRQVIYERQSLTEQVCLLVFEIDHYIEIMLHHIQ